MPLTFDVENPAWDKVANVLKLRQPITASAHTQAELEAALPLLRDFLPLDAIKSMPVSTKAKNDLASRFLENLASDSTKIPDLLAGYRRIKINGGVINPQEAQRLEVLVCSHLHDQIANAKNNETGLLHAQASLKAFSKDAEFIGLDVEKMHGFLKDPAMFAAEAMDSLPEIANLPDAPTIIAADKRGNPLAEHATPTALVDHHGTAIHAGLEKNTIELLDKNGNSLHTPAPSGTVLDLHGNPVTSETYVASVSSKKDAGTLLQLSDTATSTEKKLLETIGKGERKWFQCLTHNEEAVFSGKRTAISAVIIAAVGAGIAAMSRKQETKRDAQPDLTRG